MLHATRTTPLSHALEETTTTRIIRLCRLTNVCSTFITIIILLSVIFFLLTCRKGKAFFIICKQIDVFFFPFVIISKKRRSITVNLPTAKRSERPPLPPHHCPSQEAYMASLFKLWDSILPPKGSYGKEIFTKISISKAIIPLFSPRHVRISYAPPPTQYAHGLSDLSRTCIGGESEVVRSRDVFVTSTH